MWHEDIYLIPPIYFYLLSEKKNTKMESSSPPTLPSGSPAPSTPTLDNPTPSSHTLGLTPTPNPTPASASASGPAADPTPSSENEASDPNKPNAPNTANTFDSLLDREQRAVAEMLSRFKNLVSLAKIDDNDGASATKEVAAAQAFALDVESVALVGYLPPFSLPTHFVCL